MSDMEHSNTSERSGASRGRIALAGLGFLAVLSVMPPVIGDYHTLLLTYGLIMAIAATGFNLLLGYTGLLSFGHSAFFGTGAYTAAFIMRDLGIHSLEAWVLGGLVSSLVISALFGFVCVRHTKIFFAILTLALSQVLWSLAIKFFWVTGGTDGIRVEVPTLLGGTVSFSGRGSFVNFVDFYYYYILVVFAVCVAAMWLVVNSPFGTALQAIRDNETRAEFVGIKVRSYRWIAFVVSGAFAGLAGTLWVPLNGLVTPEALYWPFSGEILFLALLGGFKNFTGPIVGAIVFTFLKAYAVGSTEYWQLVLGVVLVTLVLFLPTGIVGGLSRAVAYLKSARDSGRAGGGFAGGLPQTVAKPKSGETV